MIQIYFIVIVQSKLRSYKVLPPDDEIKNPVSVIICARNEQINLSQNLPGILEQNYPDFEVIVVNDCSSDDSEHLLRDLSQHYPHLKIVHINEHERFKHGKKFAVTLGIKAAKNELLLFTDADCVPVSGNWINSMQCSFKGQTEIVLGYSPYRKTTGILNRIIRLETVYTAVNYLSFALGGNPYMGVGRNMAYKRTLFFKAKGFASHMHILSGDDDLFINQNANSTNTLIQIGPDSHMLSEPKQTFSEYWKQKIRHIGAGKAYKYAHKQILTLQSATAVLFYVLLFILIGLKLQWQLLLLLYGLRLMIQYIIYIPSFKKLQGKDLLWWLPVLDLIYYFLMLALSVTSLFTKKTSWK